MISSFFKGLVNRSALNNISQILLLFVLLFFAFLSLIMPASARPSTYQLNPGDVVSSDIQAPRSLSFISEVLSEKVKGEAEASVPLVYLPADPSITRRQLEKLRLTFSYITSVRADRFSSLEQKVSDLTVLNDIEISSEVSNQILIMDEIRWQTIQQETLRVLEQIMRNSIREDRVWESQKNVPAFVSFSLPQEQANIVIELATSFIVPNSLYSEEMTKSARKEARDGVKPIVRKYMAGEIIVGKGYIISDLEWETLQQFGLIVAPNNSIHKTISAALQVISIGFLAILYFLWRKLTLLSKIRNLLLISCLFLVFLYAARYLLPNTTVIPYLFPLSAFGLTLACLLTPEIGLVFSMILGVLAAYGLTNNLELSMYYFIPGFCGILALGKARRIANFFMAGIVIGATGCVVIITYRMQAMNFDLIGIATLMGSSLINGMASASMALLLQFLFSNLLGITTSLRLVDLSRPNHPLLQYILVRAPGTYQHSLQVANLAEQAAEAIGVDSLLVRVGALYHDAGKAENPSFFIENQIIGSPNPHDRLEPEVSAKLIIQHVYDGISLAHKFRLPSKIQDFIVEHHGSMLARYQYSKALEREAAGKIDPSRYSYPGPSPRTKEAAILMIADGCEAKARADLPKDQAEVRKIINKVIDYLLHEGQFNNTMLTFQELSEITESFIITLQNAHHPRLHYPDIQLENEENHPSLTESTNNYKE